MINIDHTQTQLLTSEHLHLKEFYRESHSPHA